MSGVTQFCGIVIFIQCMLYASATDPAVCDGLPTLDVSMGSTTIQSCVTNTIDLSTAQQDPNIKFASAVDSQWYTLIMVDADAAEPPYVQWIISEPGSVLTGEGIVKGTDHGTVEYESPSPAQGSGVHRYQLFLYENYAQPDQTPSSMARGSFDHAGYISQHELTIKAGFEFKTQNP